MDSEWKYLPETVELLNLARVLKADDVFAMTSAIDAIRSVRLKIVFWMLDNETRNMDRGIPTGEVRYLTWMTNVARPWFNPDELEVFARLAIQHLTEAVLHLHDHIPQQLFLDELQCNTMEWVNGEILKRLKL